MKKNKCKKCNEITETPIFLQTMQDMFDKNTEMVVVLYHSNGHKLFSGE